MDALSITARRRVRLLLALAAVALVALVAALGPAGASADTATPGWFVDPQAIPTDFQAGTSAAGGQGVDKILVNVVNEGQGSTTLGSPITITDTLPPGVTLSASGSTELDQAGNSVSCSASGQVVTCTDTDSSKALAPDQMIELQLHIDVAAGATSGTNTIAVSGGGVPMASTTDPLTINSDDSSPARGVASFYSLFNNAEGNADTAGGSHPYSQTTAFTLNTSYDPTVSVTYPNGKSVPDDNLKDLQVQLPTGFIGDPTTIPTCTATQLAALPTGCPVNSQVGTITLDLLSGNTVIQTHYPVYNMVAPAGSPAEFGFDALNELLLIHFSVRTGSDYGITAEMNTITQTLEPIGSILTLWGNPSDATHDTVRTAAGNTASTATPTALLTMPTSCDSSALSTSFSADFWGAAGQWSSLNSSAPPVTGCGALGFSPRLSAQPTTSVGESPTGLNVGLAFDQGGVTDPSGTAESHLRDATVSLPQGMTVNSSAASGLTGCAPDQIGINDASAPTCPDSSKIGTTTIDSPLLPDQMTGGIYVAKQGENPFGSLLAIYSTAYADGVWIKLAGEVHADPVTGRLVTTFSNNPQLPFEEFRLNFANGSHAILATPDDCGSYSTASALSPWSGGADAAPSSSFAITSGCVAGFSPSLTAGSQNAQAGAYSPFSVSLTRADTDQNLAGLTVRLPEGLLARLAGVPECTDAQLAHASSATAATELAEPSCPAGSQVGTVEAGAGTGPDPFFLSGKVYLTGPYMGAPYGLAVVVPALAGPYDLGTVVVRQALEVDPTTTQVTDVSDPFPTILQGIPLDIRRVDVDVNRSGFTVNPTDCAPTAVDGTALSIRGASAALSSRFQVGGCGDLGFAPKLEVTLKGATGRSGHPALRALLTTRPGQANIGRAQVNLPHGEFLDQGNLGDTCTRPVLQESRCPTSSVYGYARAWTPLLEKPLEGNVYLVGGYGYKLPALVAELDGQIRVLLVGKIDTGPNHGIRATFESVPDAPISRFELRMKGGKKYGLLENSEALCQAPKATRRAIARFTGQDGKVEHFKPVVANQCGKTKHKGAGGKKG